MNNVETIADITATGKLGVCYLKRYWSRHILTRQGRNTAVPSPDEWKLDNLILCGLGLAVEETLQYLGATMPTFDAFEDWILNFNDGAIPAERIERINAAVMGTAIPEATDKWLQQIEATEPVLSAEDLAFWDENGYVILHDAISPDACQATESAVWDFLKMDRDDPESWYQKPLGKGIMVSFYHHPVLEANRRSPRIHKAFAQLWKTADLWVTTDRVSLNPPERQNWRFPGPHLHWDTSLMQPVPFGTQGLMYLTDTPAEQGAFTCVPGFQRSIEAWLNHLPPDADPRQQDLERLGAKPIAAHAGDLIIWHHALPHGSRPNHGARPRIVQYINMYPVHSDNRVGWR